MSPDTQHHLRPTSRLRRLMPDAQSLQRHRWLQWLGPALQQPGLWHLTRRGMALGMALGVFFGLLVPIAQIPLSAAAAVALRANVPAAVASTLVSNPITFAPLYYGAWRLGSALLDEPSLEKPAALTARMAPRADGEGWWSATLRGLRSVGKPLMLGLVILATAVGLITYVTVACVWDLRAAWARRRREAADAVSP